MCHGDYNSNNLLLAENHEVMMIDFDRAYYGLPLDDFRFLLVSLMKNPKNDAVKRTKLLFDLYFSICPLYAPYKSVYVADAMFPHVFYSEAVGREKQKQALHSPSSLDLLTRLAEQLAHPPRRTGNKKIRILVRFFQKRGIEKNETNDRPLSS
ncbi:phosphotransferase [Geobacillus zalihae]|uniref:phosphotransferase n=1 Tax=Geobacillus zalihae TaxID=213419 RepID=UPI001F60760C|nr:phosphotransferase [Geobacillus zalihae]